MTTKTSQKKNRSKKLSLRPIKDTDIDFLSTLYASTRAAEMEVVPWSDEEKKNFLQWQFEAQHTHYMEHYAKADFDIIMRGKKPVGRLYVDRWDDTIRIVDIALLPQYQGQGIGSRFMKDLISEAEQAGVTVTIHVEHNNPALSLYKRLGFKRIDTNGVYHLMEWRTEEQA